MKKIPSGLLVVIEGIDGTGKSSLCKNIQAELSAIYQVVLTKEPGGTPLGKGLRTTLLQKDVPVCDKAEFLLFATDRAQHFNEVITPQLEAGALILSDRGADSSLVYQGHGRQLGTQMIQMINTWAMNNKEPDLVIYLKLPAKIAYERMEARNIPLNSFEQETSFMEKLTEGFDTLVAPRNNVLTLDAQLSQEELTDQAIAAIKKLIEKK
jgi:dTMP kinase